MDRPDQPDRRRLSPGVDPTPEPGPPPEVAAPLRDDPVVAGLLGACTFPAPGAAVACGVSGGADSLSLLVLAAAAGLAVTAVHVDHGLRAGSAAEAEVVRAAAERFGAGFRAERVAVAPGPNLEARARTARHAALPPGALLGHTADDRAETLLLNLLRGAGPTGLAALGPSPRRPILALRRRDTEGLCRHLGLVPVDDPSNRDPAFRRNRVRHELLPLLAAIAERDPVPLLVRQGDLFADLDRDLDGLAGALDPASAAALRDAPTSVARAALRRWFREAGVNGGYAPTAAAIERVLAVARHEVRATEVDGGWRITRRGGRLTLHPPDPPA